MKKNLKILFILCLLVFILNCFYKKGISSLEYKLPISLFQIQSGSMKPEIEIGEIVVLWKKDRYEVKDIVTYKDKSYFITHRIVKKEENGYVTKGDYNNTEDEEIVVKDQIQGKVIFHSKLLGKICQYRYYLIILLILIILFI